MKKIPIFATTKQNKRKKNMQNTTMTKHPRVDVADVLRGIAVMGIILLHSIEHFNFYSYPDTAGQSECWTSVTKPSGTACSSSSAEKHTPFSHCSSVSAFSSNTTTNGCAEKTSGDGFAGGSSCFSFSATWTPRSLRRRYWCSTL